MGGPILEKPSGKCGGRDHSVIQQTLMEPLVKMVVKDAQNGSAMVPAF